MKLSASYQEIECLVHKATKEDIKFNAVSSDTLGVCYTKKVGPFSPTMKANVKVESIVGNTIVCSLGDGLGMKALVAIAKLPLEKNGASSYIHFKENNKIHVDLQSIPQLKEVLKQFTLTSIRFTQDEAMVQAQKRS